MKLSLKPGLMLLTLLATFVFGATSTVFANEADMKALKEALTMRIPAAVNATVKPTPIEGLYEVMAGGQILYTTKEARYVFEGDLVDMKTRQNLTENARGSIRLDVVNKLGEKNMLVYTPKGKVKHTITVFTDIYCPYCRKLHDEMDDYMENGVKVRYIFVPFKGPRSVQTSVSVWCADDRNKAMDMAKGGKEVDNKTCDNPVSQHQALATQIGIRGTPAIMLESGKLYPGYVPFSKLLPKLDGTL